MISSSSVLSMSSVTSVTFVPHLTPTLILYPDQFSPHKDLRMFVIAASARVHARLPPLRESALALALAFDEDGGKGHQHNQIHLEGH